MTDSECNWFGSCDKLIFFVSYVYYVPATRISVIEIILYLIIADTHLQTLFNLLNITFENILNC